MLPPGSRVAQSSARVFRSIALSSAPPRNAARSSCAQQPRRLGDRPLPQDFHPVGVDGVEPARLHPLDQQGLAGRRAAGPGATVGSCGWIVPEPVHRLERVGLVAVAPVQRAGVGVEPRQNPHVRVDVDRPGPVGEPRLRRRVAGVHVEVHLLTLAERRRPPSSRGSCRRGAGSPARPAAAAPGSALRLGCWGFCWLLAARNSLPSARSGIPTRLERGVIGQVARLPDDLAVVGPPAGQLERGHRSSGP